MNTNDVATMTGLSVRTLHHYDKIGLLCPNRNQESGYRKYSEEDLDKLQQILFFKECGFTLAKIKELLDSPWFDREKAFELQKQYLLHEKKRIDAMLQTLNKTMRAMKGEVAMSPKEKFKGFDFSDNPYEEEARRLWGNEAVDKSKAWIESKSADEQNAIGKGMDDLFKELALLRDDNPAGEPAQAAMDKMYKYFNQNFGYHYTLEAFAGLGQMYVEDSRFTENIDQYGEGLSVFLREAMNIYAQSKA